MRQLRTRRSNQKTGSQQKRWTPFDLQALQPPYATMRKQIRRRTVRPNLRMRLTHDVTVPVARGKGAGTAVRTVVIAPQSSRYISEPTPSPSWKFWYLCIRHGGRTSAIAPTFWSTSRSDTLSVWCQRCRKCAKKAVVRIKDEAFNGKDSTLAISSWTTLSKPIIHHEFRKVL